MTQLIHTRRHTRALLIGAALFCVLCALAWGWGGNHLFERVLVRGISVPNAASSARAAPAAAENSVLIPSDPVKAMETNAKTGIWHVRAQSGDILIERHTSGTGADLITYFTADITVQSGKAFAACFAKDEYGENIREKTSSMARRAGAVFAFNGDYYGYRSDGIVIRNGVLYRDVPSDRTGLMILSDGRMEIYDEATASAQDLLAAGAWDTFSFGPVLVKDGAVCEGLNKPYGVDTTTIQKKQPRTAIGMFAPGHYLVVVADGRREGYSCGMTFTELAQVFQDSGCQLAYNLDGGNSATLFACGSVINRPSSKYKERSISDAICIF